MIIINTYALNIRTLKYIRQILTDLKGKVDNNTLMVENFNTLLPTMGRSSRQEFNKEHGT